MSPSGPLHHGTAEPRGGGPPRVQHTEASSCPGPLRRLWLQGAPTVSAAGLGLQVPCSPRPRGKCAVWVRAGIHCQRSRVGRGHPQLSQEGTEAQEGGVTAPDSFQRQARDRRASSLGLHPGPVPGGRQGPGPGTGPGGRLGALTSGSRPDATLSVQLAGEPLRPSVGVQASVCSVPCGAWVVTGSLPAPACWTRDLSGPQALPLVLVSLLGSGQSTRPIPAFCPSCSGPAHPTLPLGWARAEGAGGRGSGTGSCPAGSYSAGAPGPAPTL